MNHLEHVPTGFGLYRSILRKGAVDGQEADRYHCEREKIARDY